jgi:nicotinate dehydrogenase subunit B
MVDQRAAELKRRYRLDTEPERYELQEGVAYSFALSRREWISALGAGLTVVVAAPPSQANVADAAEWVSTRLHLGENGIVTVLTGKVEVGQGARTEIAQAAAEELRLPVEKVRVLMGDTALCPDDGGTWGSMTTPQTIPEIRRAAAAARTLLASGGGPNALRAAAPAGVELTSTKEWKVLGQSIAALDGRDIVTGTRRYIRDHKGLDASRPALWGRIVRAPAYAATLVSADTEAAARMPGVTLVRDGSFLGVAAPDRATADAAAELIRAEWKSKPLTPAAQLPEHFRQTAKPPEGQSGGRYSSLMERGDVDAALARANQRHESSYSVAPIAHVPLEPRSAIAEWKGDFLTVYAGGQAPFLVRKQLADAFRIPEGNVRVISCDTGGGYGGKHTAECDIEAARLARAAGQPVRLQWSRQEEFTYGYGRPAGLMEVRSATSGEGRLEAWDFHNYNSGAASILLPYDAAHFRCAFHRAESPLRQGSYRSLAAVANAFARESHVEELAAFHKDDPLEFRLRNLSNPRLRDVLERAADRFGWAKRNNGGGHGSGIACNIEKDGIIAMCAEVAADGASTRVLRAVIAVDVGAVLNPGNLKNQITGAVIQGLGGALFEELRYDEHQLRNARLSAYRVPRFEDVPEIEVILVDRKDTPSAGAGESPITVVAPAVAAAIHAATGTRLRRLPLMNS